MTRRGSLVVVVVTAALAAPFAAGGQPPVPPAFSTLSQGAPVNLAAGGYTAKDLYFPGIDLASVRLAGPLARGRNAYLATARGNFVCLVTGPPRRPAPPEVVRRPGVVVAVLLPLGITCAPRGDLSRTVLAQPVGRRTFVLGVADGVRLFEVDGTPIPTSANVAVVSGLRTVVAEVGGVRTPLRLSLRTLSFTAALPTGPT